ncbi:MAG: retropepsin-like domain-containing protein, partial [Actinobacteria bacterium]|nr:retropepsin-like domain-containing protein [Actinomycetota bacterium]
EVKSTTYTFFTVGTSRVSGWCTTWCTTRPYMRQNPSGVLLAKIDTGAGYSSIDEDLAEDLGIDLDDPEDEVEIESANGEEKRPLVRLRIRIAGRTLDTRVTVTDRSELSKDVLVGSRDLDGFLIKPNEEWLTSPDGPRP